VCLVQGERVSTYADLLARERQWRDELDAHGLRPGAVAAVRSDYSLDGIALLLALLSRRCIAALLPRDTSPGPLLEDTCAEAVLRCDAGGGFAFETRNAAATHPLLEQLRARHSGGFVIFSSGSSGRAKAVLHDVERFLIKFERPGKRLRTLAFLLFDHIAGMDTLFYTLCAGGALALPDRRDADHVATLIARHRVQVLPASPSFLRLLLLSGACERHDLSSLEIVTYGSEPMDEATLARVVSAFPNARVLQKYGTSEVGSPRSRSRGNSLWLELAGGDVERKVEDGMLWLRSPAAMLGYLNAPDPFDADGWYCTGDLVERDGAWIRVLGRASDLINVGGEKVFPQEVEEVILELAFVCDVVVKGVPHPLLGQAVHAEVELHEPRSIPELRRQVRQHCLARLSRHKVPVQVVEARGSVVTSRQKKLRR